MKLIKEPTDDDLRQIAGIMFRLWEHARGRQNIDQYRRDIESLYDPGSPAHWSGIDLYKEHEFLGDAKAFALVTHVAVHEWMRRQGSDA